ncbi:MAG TPA: hypothetical protein VJ851_07405 [Jatrophihabitans sp.]|nr:hypothetical protein [Jatrophihabitans sp.]
MARAEASDLDGIAAAAAADPNWWLSSILQCSVALAVALATLWLLRTKERNRAMDACRLAQERVVSAERAFGLVNAAIERQAALSWLIQGMEQLVRTPEAGLDFLLSRCGPWEYEASVLAEAVAEVCGYVRNAQAEIVDAADGEPLVTEWDDFRIRRGMPVLSPLREMVYERVYLRLMASQRTNAVQAFRQGGPGPEPAATVGPTPRHDLVVTSAEAQHLETERAGIVQQMFEAAMAEESAQAQLARASQGWSARWYLAVTVYLGSVGIVMPSILLTLAPTALRAELRWLLFVAFCSVVLAVASAFAITIRVRGGQLLSRGRR